MADQLELLKRFQALDGELYRLREQLQEKPRELEQVQAEVAAQEARFKGVETRLKALQVSQKGQDIELQTREASVKKLQGQLFQVKTNKEYTTMQREIDSLKADNSLLEEQILAAFEAIDQATKERSLEERQLAEQQKRLRAEQTRIEQESAQLAERIAQLERDRLTLVPDIPPGTLVSYERVLHLREGLALVPLVEESCGGCHRRLPPQVISRVYLKADLVACENCNRFLYFDGAQSTL